jgi:hypothetical protein
MPGDIEICYTRNEFWFIYTQEAPEFAIQLTLHTSEIVTTLPFGLHVVDTPEICTFVKLKL